LLVQQRDNYVHGLKQVVIAADGQTLGIGQSLLEARSEFIHSHRIVLSRRDGEAANAQEVVTWPAGIKHEVRPWQT
jgi:hypothetical protein